MVWWWMLVQRTALLSPYNQRARAFLDKRGRRFHVETAVSSDSHLETDHQLSDLHHLDHFKYSYSSVSGSVCSHFSEASSRNCGSLCHGSSLGIM